MCNKFLSFSFWNTNIFGWSNFSFSIKTDNSSKANHDTNANCIIHSTYIFILEEKCGHNYDKTDGVKTLTIPKNGILILNEDFDGYINFKYYLVDDLGNKTEIKQILSFKSNVKKQPCVLVGGSGTIGQTIEANSTNHEEKRITYSDFYVYNKDTVDRNDYKIQQKFDSLTTAIVNHCRQEK